MQQLSETIDNLLVSFLQTDFSSDLQLVLQKYEESFQRQQKEEFAIDFYPTLYSEFMPIMAIQQPSSQYIQPINIKQNLSLQNKLKIQRPESHRSKVIKSSKVCFEEEQYHPAYSPLYPAVSQTKNSMPKNKIALKQNLPKRIQNIQQTQPLDVNDDVEFDFDKIENGTLYLQKFCKVYSQKQLRFRKLLSIDIIQRYCKVYISRTQFIKVQQENEAQLQGIGIDSQQNGVKIIMQLSSEIRKRITNCQHFFTEIFQYQIPKYQFYFPVQMTDLLATYWDKRFEKQIIQNLQIDESTPQLQPVENMLKLKFDLNIDTLIDYFFILSQTNDSFREGYRSSDVSPVISFLALASGSMVGSLVVLTRNTIKTSYQTQLLDIKVPICIINVLEGFSNIQNLNLHEIDTLQLFLANQTAQSQFFQFQKFLADQRKKQKHQKRYVQIGLLTSNFYLFDPIQQQKNIAKFTKTFKIPLVFNDPIQTNNLYNEIQQYVSENSNYLKQIQIDDKDTPLDNELRILNRGHPFTDILALSHAPIDSYLIQIKKIKKISRSETSILTGKKSRRVLTMSGLRARVQSKEDKIDTAIPDKDIQIEVYDGDFFIDEKSAESVKIMGDLPVTNYSDEELDSVVTISMKPFLPIKDVDIIAEDINQRITEYVLSRIQTDQLQLKKPDNYRLISLNMDLFRYKIKQQIVTQKTVQHLQQGCKQTNIINFTDLNTYQPHIPDTYEEKIFEQTEEIIHFQHTYTANLTIFVENYPEFIVTYITSSEDVVERKFGIPARSHGWLFPARLDVFEGLKTAAIPIINLLIRDSFSGFCTIQFLVGPSIEPFNCVLGVNQHILQFLAVQKICNLEFNQQTGGVENRNEFGIQKGRKSVQYSILCIDICHELIRRSDLQKLKQAVLGQFAFDSFEKTGWLYDWADDIFAINVSPNGVDWQKKQAEKLVKAVLGVLHKQFQGAVTSVSQGVDRKKNMSYQQIREVEMGSNCIGILRSLTDGK